jgi:glyoxylase-like metal-dependent hydrolase (beta-lactamase superfamily II)
MGMRLIGPVYLVGGQDFNMVYLDWPANDCNTYLVDTGDPLVLVDCGCGESLSGILTNIEEMEFDLQDVSHVLVTHAHLPHAGAAEALRKNGAEIVAGPETARALRAGDTATAAWYYSRRFPPVGEVTEIEHDEELELGGCSFRALHLPGHSAGSMGYELCHGERRILFCGDAVRSPGEEQIRNRLDYDAETYRETLLGLLEEPPDVLYPGHGPFCLSHPEHWIAEELKKLLAAP